MPEIDTANHFGVAPAGSMGHLRLLLPPRPGHALTRDQALSLAAWLVALADPTGDRFPAVLEAVRGT